MLIMMDDLLFQLKKRRLALGLKQNDMLMRVGISRQQYQRLESKGNPRLDTLALITKGLNSELMIVPQEKLNAVLAVLEGDDDKHKTEEQIRKSLSDDPWQNILEDD